MNIRVEISDKLWIYSGQCCSLLLWSLVKCTFRIHAWSVTGWSTHNSSTFFCISDALVYRLCYPWKQEVTNAHPKCAFQMWPLPSATAFISLLIPAAVELTQSPKSRYCSLGASRISKSVEIAQVSSLPSLPSPPAPRRGFHCVFHSASRLGVWQGPPLGNPEWQMIFSLAMSPTSLASLHQNHDKNLHLGKGGTRLIQHSQSSLLSMCFFCLLLFTDL